MEENFDDVVYEIVEVDEFEIIATTLLYSFIAPVGSLLVEQVFMLPWLVEELIKGWLVTRMEKLEEKQIKMAFLVGLVFGLSEAMLYVVNVSFLGVLEPLALRLVLTVPMHAVTAGIFGVFSRGRGWWKVVGMGLAMAIHGLFNVVVS